MNSKIFFLTILTLILGILVGFFVFALDKQEKIEREIVKANYCQTTADCQVVTGKCPFGCYLPVNRAEALKIESLVNNYESNCVYSCIELKGMDCVNNKCQIQY